MSRIVFVLLGLFSVCVTDVCAAEKPLVPKLQEYVEKLLVQPTEMTAERQRILTDISKIAAERLKAGKTVDLLFVCTHNSRRSQMCQLWATAAAQYYGIQGVATHSGGTENTAFNPRAVAAIERAGFAVKTTVPGENPHYEVSFATKGKPAEAFSKVYNSESNPCEDFVAVMVCGDADEKCPLVAGSAARISLHFVDPKVSDGTDKEAETYDARCRQIAQEMLFVMRQAKRLMNQE